MLSFINCKLTLALLLLLGALVAAQSSGARQPAAADDIQRRVWDLSALYADEAAWETERALVQRKLASIGRWQGRLGRSALSLADGLDEISDLRRRAHRLSVYGNLVSAVNTRSELAQRQYEVGTACETRVEAAISFAAAELGRLAPATQARWLRAEPRLAVQRRFINQARREAPHTLAPAAQAILRKLGDRLPQLTSDSYVAWLEADLGWPAIKDVEGKEISVDPGAFGALWRSPRRAERQAAAQAYFGRLRSLERGFGLLLTRRIEADLAVAQARRFNDGLEAIFFLKEGMPPGSQRVMTEVARANLAAFQRYARLRCRAFGAQPCTYADLFAPPAAQRRFTVAESAETIIAASAPLGADYQARLRERLTKPWMHLPPAPEKRALYGIFPPVGGAPPYTIMSYRGTAQNSRAFAGAATLMMCFADIPPACPTRATIPAFTRMPSSTRATFCTTIICARATERQERIDNLIGALDRLRMNGLLDELENTLNAGR